MSCGVYLLSCDDISRVSVFFFFSSRRRHTRSDRDWSSDVCSSDLFVVSMDKLSADHFRDDEAARQELERILWPNGPVCPHCGVVDGRAYPLKRARSEERRVGKECRSRWSPYH